MVVLLCETDKILEFVARQNYNLKSWAAYFLLGWESHEFLQEVVQMATHELDWIWLHFCFFLLIDFCHRGK